MNNKFPRKYIYKHTHFSFVNRRIKIKDFCKDLQRPVAAVVRIPSESEFDFNLLRPTMNNFVNGQSNRNEQHSPTVESSSFDVNNAPARAKVSK